MSDAAIRLAADIMQWVDLALAGSILLLSLLVLRRWRRGWRLVVLPFTYAIFSTAFYTAVLLSAIPQPWISLLSASLRLYSYVLVLAIGGVVVLYALRHEDDDVSDDD